MLYRLIADGLGPRVSPVAAQPIKSNLSRQAGQLKNTAAAQGPGRRRRPIAGLIEPLPEPLAQGWPASVQVIGAV